jgi:hypothetical protein
LKPTNPFAQINKIKLKKLKTSHPLPQKTQKNKTKQKQKGASKLTNPFAQNKQPSSPHPNPIC